MRIVSLNCWGGRVNGPLMTFLKEVNADIYCLQEVYSAPPEVPRELLYDGENADVRPCRPHLFDEIRKALPDHHATFFPSSQGHLLDSVSAAPYRKIRYGIATYVREAIPVIESRSGFVSGAYRPKEWGPQPLPRTAHCFRVYDYESDRQIIVAHMHGLWDRRGKEDTPERSDQIENLIDFVTLVQNNSEEPTVVCGDFNVLPHSYTIRALRDRGFIELVTTGGHTDTRTRLYKKPNRIPWADYMLVTKSVQVEAFSVPAEPEVSDHRPLILDLS